MASDIRLCVVSPLYSPTFGGVGRQAVTLTRRLRKECASIFVICRGMKGIPEWNEQDDIPVVRVKSLFPHRINLQQRTILNFITSMSFCLLLVFELFRRRTEYDIVHFHGASLPLLISVLPLKFLGKRVIAKVAGAKMDIEAGSFRGKYLFLGNFFVRILRSVDAFIAISTEIKTDLLSDGFSDDRIFTISNFVATDEFRPVDDEMKKRELKRNLLRTDRTVITFSGRLVTTKRLDVLFSALPTVLKSFRDIQLVILGDGDLREPLRELALELGIERHVTFMGFTPNVVEYLQATDIFIFPSEREGMPNAVLEAMACRLPVIAAIAGGTTDVIRTGVNGLLVNPGDAGELARSIMTVLGDGCLAASMAEKALRTIREGYSIDATASKYIELYRKILHGT
jgi:glycosyltransferase involved in cell wall biosynthesis